ncbi:hypothetical protein P154DRAFT_555831 [Amniculicola lignicola CBS 123094]|uniref:Post-SET domain-containing protein n=1 Tax=Amniculicola lignicola CBS 123094 TaxID=1392246 RepID=A0A6A5W936_9PLEO|nr:hypothetical protein P154DRAFT_555831 [Amniculicola lignicola CBS 123094]
MPSNESPIPSAPGKHTPASSSSIPPWVSPHLPSLLRVEHGPNYTSRALSLVDLPPGALFARITSPTAAKKAYTSVQAGRDLHIELNSDLVFINHSCKPKLVFDMRRWEVRVAGGGEGIRVGDELTFFYPSTEWEMDRGFECRCGEVCCRGWIRGAREMEESVLEGYWLSGHVGELLGERKLLIHLDDIQP